MFLVNCPGPRLPSFLMRFLVRTNDGPGTGDGPSTKNQGRGTSSALCFDELFVVGVLVQEFEREGQDLPGELLGVEIAKLLHEVSDRHHRLRHGAMAAGVTDVVE